MRPALLRSNASRLLLARPAAQAPSVALFASAPRPQQLLQQRPMSSTPPAFEQPSKVKQPAWAAPEPSTQAPKLKVWNSLTRSKVEFVPKDGRQVTWYNCGPTVYDASHMGHARNYVTQDVLRRILQDYFNYDVHFVMNVTDIDDKIILRSRQDHLRDALRAETATLDSTLVSKARESWAAFLRKNVGKDLAAGELPEDDGSEERAWDAELEPRWTTDPAWRAALEAKEEKMSMYWKVLASGRQAIKVAETEVAQGVTDKARADALIDAVADPLGLWLDKQFGATVTSPSISRALAARWEKAFMADMSALNVLPPSTLTRVSEYVPEIVSFVERVVERGFAYSDGEGGVWFDVKAFDGHKSEGQAWEHTYAKLAPWSKGNMRLLEEGEGSLGSQFAKRSPSDFALWKGSKPGEPSWPSPWGAGRPGWHIECSVMATEVLGEGMDIHSGGVDLQFPHHDNEIAQSEAFHGCQQWVNYFFHTGHLHIEGLKMSKSLKNFITIGEALERNSARQLRLAFIMTVWNAKMDFKHAALDQVRSIESTFNNFFTIMKARISQAEASEEVFDGKHHYDEEEKQLTADIKAAQAAFRAALCDSFDTPTAVQVLADLTGKASSFLRLNRSNLGAPTAAAEWIGRMLRMLGLGEGPKTELGWGSKEEAGAGADSETLLMPYLRALSSFRDEIRRLAIAKADSQEILALTDRLRDYEMAELGVALDDQADGRALVKLVPADTLVEAREAKIALAAQKQAEAGAKKEAARRALLDKMAKAKVPAADFFRPPNVPEGTYTAWDDAGVPTKDAEGVDLSKAQAKKLAKAFEAQVKANASYAKWQAEEDAAAGPSS